MKCPACCETIKSGATLCRYCSTAIPDDVRARDSTHQVAWYFASVIGVVLLVKGCADITKRPDPVTATSAAEQPARYIDVGECKKLVAGMRRVGVIRKVSGTEIYVNDTLWRRLDLDAKRGLLGAALCADKFGRVDTGAAYAYSAYSGKQLAHYQPDAFGLTIDAE